MKKHRTLDTGPADFQMSFISLIKFDATENMRQFMNCGVALCYYKTVVKMMPVDISCFVVRLGWQNRKGPPYLASRRGMLSVDSNEIT